MVRVSVDDHILELSNLDKVLYPQTGFTKGEVLDYYARVSAAILPHIRDRAVTRRRWPDGVEGPTFFEKNAPRGKPSWVRTIMVPSPGSTRGTEEVEYPLIEHTAALIYFANLAALELHVPQWRIDEDDGLHDPDRLVIDLDPGPPASIVECCQVALALRERLADDGLSAWPKTSGGKGMQLYVPIAETPADAVEGYAKGLAGQLARAQPDLVVATMARRLRPGKVFLDWDQNKPTKTTVAPYSLRGEAEPRVSTPVTWEEVEACRVAADLRFGPAEVLERVESNGDLLEPMFSVAQHLPERASSP